MAEQQGSNFQMQLLPLIEADIKLMRENFEKYFASEQNATLDANSWMLYPFTYDNISYETEGLIDLQSDFAPQHYLKRHHILSFGCTY